MAKQQQQKPQPVTAPKKNVKGPATFDPFTYLLRNFLIILGVGALFFFVDNSNKKESEVHDWMNEFQQLRRANQNPARQQELYEQIMAVQNDTSYFKDITKGYHWAIHELALGNLSQINEIKEKVESGQMKPLTYEDKLGYRVALYPFLKYINEHTPASPNTVLLLPPGDSIISNESKWNYIYEPEWVEYFIYPRLCVAPGLGEQLHPDLAKRITHVVIVNGEGYDRLKYNVPVEQRVKETVLPIDAPPSSIQPETKN